MTIRPASADEMDVVRLMFREYEADIKVDLCFQGFAEELAGLPGRYAVPAGVILLAWDGAAPLGCVAMRPLDPDTCEMKRLFVRPAARGTGLGRMLVDAILAAGRAAGYSAIRLDTLPQMQRAIQMYRQIGFVDIPPYNNAPLVGVVYLQKSLLLPD